MNGSYDVSYHCQFHVKRVRDPAIGQGWTNRGQKRCVCRILLAHPRQNIYTPSLSFVNKGSLRALYKSLYARLSSDHNHRLHTHRYTHTGFFLTLSGSLRELSKMSDGDANCGFISTHKEWPEVVGMLVDEAEKVIKKEMPEANIVVLASGTPVPRDLKYDRVRIVVNTVCQTPQVRSPAAS